MEIAQIKLEVVTPMFSYGADTKNPEFRIPELKSILRRAFREFYTFESEKDLMDSEHMLFGGVQEANSIKSSLVIRSADNIKEMTKNFEANCKFVKHKNFIKKAITPSATIELIFQSRSKELLHNYIKLLMLSSIFYGLGGRSRKGLGSFRLVSIDCDKEKDVDNMDAFMEALCDSIFNGHAEKLNIKLNEREIAMKTFRRKEEDSLFLSHDVFSQMSFNEATRVKRIKIAENKIDQALMCISKWTHDKLAPQFLKSIQLGPKDEVVKILGSGGNSTHKRFASPVCLSVFKAENTYLTMTILNYNYRVLEMELNQDAVKTYVERSLSTLVDSLNAL